MPGTDQSNRRPLLATIPDSYPVMTVIPYRTAVITFLTLMLVSLVIWSRPLRGTFHLALTNDAYTHILLIFPLTVALSYLDSRFLRIDPRPSLRIGAMLLLLAFLIFCAATW